VPKAQAAIACDPAIGTLFVRDEKSPRVPVTAGCARRFAEGAATTFVLATGRPPALDPAVVEGFGFEAQDGLWGQRMIVAGD